MQEKSEPADGYIRTPFVPEMKTVVRSQCEYCQEKFIAPRVIVEDWERQHRKQCQKRREATA